MVREVIFSGPEGRIEARFHQSEERNAPIALVLHPHPLHGGTMNNKVVYHTFQAFVRNGFSVLRFNFRGVGKSQGVFDHGAGELIDAAAAMDWLQLQCPDHSSCWIAGFSFGAWISLQLLMRRPEVDGFVAISPPASSYDFNFLSPCPAQGLIVQGTKDRVVKEEAVFGLYEKLAKQRNSSIEYAPIDGDHFFTGNHETLSTTIENYIAPRAVKGEAFSKKVRRDRRRRNAA
ncbi:MAG: alpha/beta hydrolase [Candidatus Jidaibacter sp.]|jgi:alpha/beta superfamily hydrolase|nr:alpha/beta hydrolase [Candidatus Jidaibacter sp.]